MGKQVFNSHHFSIHQDRCAMKVSTDGIILGSLADIEGARSILDIGTGTALLALMCAQRNGTASITAVEIDGPASIQAGENVNASPWAERMLVVQSDIRRFSEEGFEAIICNPPYYEGDLRSPNDSINQAKHSTQITLVELIKCTKTLLSKNARASFIFPKHREKELMEIAADLGLYPNRIVDIIYQEGAVAKRFVVTFIAEKGPCQGEVLVVQDQDNSYTNEYQALTKEFLLKRHSD